MIPNKLTRMITSAMLLALALVLPFLTGQIPQIGKALCPMHFPVLLCGFFCGPFYGALVGAAAPLLRFLLFGMPVLMPTGLAMCFELAVYGLVSGLLYGLLPKKPVSVYLSLVAAMLAGRLVWGAVMALLCVSGAAGFGWEAFLSGAVLTAVPGILIQIILIPVLVMAVERFFRFSPHSSR